MMYLLCVLAFHRYKTRNVRPYSLVLGRRIKQQLWDRMNQPTITTSAHEEGRVHVAVSYGSGVHPPLYDVDISGEPKPDEPPRKRAKKTLKKEII